MPMPERLLLCTGLLLISAAVLIGRWTNVPDFLHGFLLGAGLGMEIVALIKMQRRRLNSQ